MSSISRAQATSLFREPPQRYIEHAGGSLAYRRVGSGPDVLFVHGWPVSGATFRTLLSHLAPHMTCHVIDLLGAGQSRFGRQSPMTIDTHISGVRAVLDTLGLKSVALVGHDSGGLIARHAMAGDDRLRAMVLINTEQSRGVSLRFRQFLWMSRLPAFSHLLGWIGMQRWLRRSPLLLGDCFDDRSLLDGEFEEFFLTPLRHDPDIRWAAGRLIRSFHMRYIHDLEALHRKITAPVQLIWGEGDPFFPLEWTRSMLGTFPRAQLQVVPQAKLFVHEERPQEVATAMLSTLDGGGVHESLA